MRTHILCTLHTGLFSPWCVIITPMHTVHPHFSLTNWGKNTAKHGTPCPPTRPATPVTSHSSALVTADGPTPTHHPHPSLLFTVEVTRCCVLGQMLDDMSIRVAYEECFHCPKNCRYFAYLAPPPVPGNHWSFHCRHGSSAFSRMSPSWNRPVCSRIGSASPTEPCSFKVFMAPELTAF